MYSFVETKLFTQLVTNYLSDAEYRQVQLEIIRNPNSGSVIRGSGGVRKLRWRAPGRGKRGGYRIIYFVRRPNQVVWMLTIYPKNQSDSIPGHVLKQIRQEIEDEQE
jgi:mRNA-degrading endonuclease RelE of RelBE toxin-antitoxin system